jgi:thiol-disulfide isomerase/thioredoxin
VNAVAFGPFAFDAERLASIVGIFVFASVGSILAHRWSPRLGGWTTATILTGIITARAWHVGDHMVSFAEEPWRILAVWQGGFSTTGALVGIALCLVWVCVRNRPALPWAILTIATGLLAWLAVMQLTSQGADTPAPTGLYQTFDDRAQVVISERANRPLVLNLWATWCPPCRRELPMMAQMVHAHPDVDFIFANQGERREAIELYLKRSGLDLGTVLLDPAMALSKHYDAVGLPATLLIRADGALDDAHLGDLQGIAAGGNLRSQEE